MEVFALITINIVTAIVLYIIFSIRFSIAVDKAKHVPMTKELKDNIEASIQLMNNSLDMFDRKINSFYQLLRKSEEIAKRLEELNQADASGNDSGKRKKKSASSVNTKSENTNKAKPELKQTVPAREKTEKKLVGGGNLSEKREAVHGKFDSYSGENFDENVAALERTLAHQDRDVLDLTPESASVDAAMGIGILSRGYKEKDEQGISSGILNFLEKNGQRIRKTLGVDSMDLPEVKIEATQPPQIGKGSAKSNDLLEKISFSDMVDKEIFSSEENVKKQTTDKEKKPGIKEIMNSEGIDLSIKGRSDKNEFLRMLFDRGFTAGEISSATGISVQEIELILALHSFPKTKAGTRSKV